MLNPSRVYQLYSTLDTIILAHEFLRVMLDFMDYVGTFFRVVYVSV